MKECPHTLVRLTTLVDRYFSLEHDHKVDDAVGYILENSRSYLSLPTEEANAIGPDDEWVGEAITTAWNRHPSKALYSAAEDWYLAMGIGPYLEGFSRLRLEATARAFGLQASFATSATREILGAFIIAVSVDKEYDATSPIVEAAPTTVEVAAPGKTPRLPKKREGGSEKAQALPQQKPDATALCQPHPTPVTGAPDEDRKLRWQESTTVMSFNASNVMSAATIGQLLPPAPVVPPEVPKATTDRKPKNEKRSAESPKEPKPKREKKEKGEPLAVPLAVPQADPPPLPSIAEACSHDGRDVPLEVIRGTAEDRSAATAPTVSAKQQIFLQQDGVESQKMISVPRTITYAELRETITRKLNMEASLSFLDSDGMRIDLDDNDALEMFLSMSANKLTLKCTVPSEVPKASDRKPKNEKRLAEGPKEPKPKREKKEKGEPPAVPPPPPLPSIAELCSHDGRDIPFELFQGVPEDIARALLMRPTKLSPALRVQYRLPIGPHSSQWQLRQWFNVPDLTLFCQENRIAMGSERKRFRLENLILSYLGKETQRKSPEDEPQTTKSEERLADEDERGVDERLTFAEEDEEAKVTPKEKDDSPDVVRVIHF